LSGLTSSSFGVAVWEYTTPHPPAATQRAVTPLSVSLIVATVSANTVVVAVVEVAVTVLVSVLLVRVVLLLVMVLLVRVLLSVLLSNISVVTSTSHISYVVVSSVPAPVGPVVDDVALVLVSVVLLAGAVLLVVATGAAKRLPMPCGPWPARSAALAARSSLGPENACVGGTAASLAKPFAMGCSAPMERTLPMLMTDLARQWPFVFGDRSRAQSILPPNAPSAPAAAEANLRPKMVPARWTLKT
jgi:hypothetical protein